MLFPPNWSYNRLFKEKNRVNKVLLVTREKLHIWWNRSCHNTELWQFATYTTKWLVVKLVFLKFHYNLDGAASQQLKECTQLVITFIKQRENPYLATNFTKLYNFTTKHWIPEEATIDILIIFQHGEKECLKLWKNTFVDKTTKLSGRIKMWKLPLFSVEVSRKADSKIITSKAMVKEWSSAQRN